MNILVTGFLSMDLRIRTSLFFALAVILFWCILGKKILWIASVIPLLLKGGFKGVYCLLEIPLCGLHKMAGSPMYRVDNKMAAVGEKIDLFLEKWYMRWHQSKDRNGILLIIIVFMLVGWIFIPYHQEGKFVNGQIVYQNLEGRFIDLLKEHGWYREEAVETIENSELNSIDATKMQQGIVFVVVTARDPLSVRDVPSLEDGEILDRVKKNDTVLCTGEMTFGMGKNGNMEPWVKVETTTGVEGWARLMYLYPQEEQNLKLILQPE